MNIIYQCKYCNSTYTTKCGKSYHENRCLKNPSSDNYKNHNKERTCKKCGKLYTLNTQGSTNSFCSRSCANSRIRSNVTKQKIRESMYSYYKEHPKGVTREIKNCCICGKELCRKNTSGYCKNCIPQIREVSDETRLKLSMAGRRSAQVQKERRRSKIESMFFDKIKKIFPDAEPNKVVKDGWDTDIYLPGINLAIFWNGPCHYLPIYGEASLNQTMNRDKIKTNLFMKLGISIYVIKDLPDLYPKGVGRDTEKRTNYQLEKFVEFLHKKDILVNINNTTEQNDSKSD